MNVTVGDALDMMEKGYCLEIEDGIIGNFVQDDDEC